MEIINDILNENQYYKEVHEKKQIVIHHTAGGSNAVNVIHGWNYNQERVGTAFVIDGQGKIYKAFEPEYWAYHLGLKTGTNLALNKNSIGIEICNWGQLILKDGKYLNYLNKEVSTDQVVKIPRFRGFEFYHKYNDFQLVSLKRLLEELCYKFKIDSTFNMDIFDLCADALDGRNGMFTHVSYRLDKNDCSPQPNLIQTLTNLNKI